MLKELFRELLSKTNMAVVVSAIVIVGAFIYACITRDSELVRMIALTAIGFLFGTTVPRIARQQ